MTEDIRTYIHDSFAELHEDVDRTLSSPIPTDAAIASVNGLVTSGVTAQSKILCSTIVSRMTEQVKRDTAFQSDKNMNKFWDLQLQQKLPEKVPFRISRPFPHVGTVTKPSSAGKPVISGALTIGLICAVIAAAVFAFMGLGAAILSAGIAGFAGFVAAMRVRKSIPAGLSTGGLTGADRTAVQGWLRGIEGDMYTWAASVEDYFNRQVAALKARL